MKYKYAPDQLRLKVGDFVMLKRDGLCHQVVAIEQGPLGVGYYLDSCFRTLVTPFDVSLLNKASFPYACEGPYWEKVRRG